MLNNYLQTALCSSLPVDFISLNLERKFLFPFQTQFLAHYDKYYEQLYDQPNNMRYYDYQPDANLKEINKYIPKKFPEASLKSENESKEKRSEFSKFPLPHENYMNNQEEEPSKVLPDSLKSLQSNILIVVRNSLTRPFPQHVLERMSSNLRKIKSHVFLVQSLARCPALFEMSINSFQKAYQTFAFPYLYTATLKLLFQIYPKSPTREEWNQKSVADASRLSNIVMHKRLPGHEILRYLADATHFLAEFMKFSETQTGFSRLFIYLSDELAQYMMHMSFVLNCSKLFELVAKIKPQVFQGGDIFDWDDLLYQITQAQEKFPIFHTVLLKLRLKMKIGDKIDQNNDPSKMCKESFNLPIEERFLTDNMINSYSHSFGLEEAGQLQNLLKEWKYGAFRAKNRKL